MAQRTAAAGGLQGGARGKKDGAHGKSHRATARTVSAIEGGASIKQARSSLTPPTTPPPPLPLPPASTLPVASRSARGLRAQEKRTVAVRRGESGLGIDVSERNVILRVLPHSLAATDGVLREGDIIVGVDGEGLGKRWLAEARTPHKPCTRHAHATHTPCTRHAHAMHTPCTRHAHACSACASAMKGSTSPCVPTMRMAMLSGGSGTAGSSSEPG